MTNPNIPPETNNGPSLTRSLRCGSDNLAAAAYRSKSLDAMMAGQSAPAPVRISPEVRETLMIALRVAFHESQIGAHETEDAIAFVEALP